MRSTAFSGSLKLILTEFIHKVGLQYINALGEWEMGIRKPAVCSMLQFSMPFSYLSLPKKWIGLIMLNGTYTSMPP